mgnify:CR=1 FL=1
MMSAAEPLHTKEEAVPIMTQPLFSDMYGDYFTSTFFPLMIYKPRVALFTR